MRWEGERDVGDGGECGRERVRWEGERDGGGENVEGSVREMKGF